MGPSPDKKVPSLQELSDMGMSEIVVRVAQYNFDVPSRGPDIGYVPEKFQAIVRHVNAGNAWAVAVRANADEAEADARALFAEMYGKPEKVAAVKAARSGKHVAKPKPPVADDDDDFEGLI